jgi:hypothetical protein
MNTPRKLLFIALVLVNGLIYSQITVGSYTGITQLSNITSPCLPIVNTVLGDVDFATNSAVEIPMGTTFSGTWANGQAYSDGPGPEILCVSVHTEEWWDVELYLSDFSYTPAVNAPMLTIEDYITLDFWDCSGGLYTNFFYDRRVVALDFSAFVIPAGLQVIGARFTLTGDNAANPDPIGMLYIGGESNPTISNNGPICSGDTLELYADTITGATYSWVGPASFSSSVQNPVILNATSVNGGIYTCFITDSASVTDTLYTTVVINPLPTGIISMSSLCEFTPTGFSLVSTNDTITSYHWDFGTSASNDTSNQIIPSFTYSGGTYNVSLIVTSDEGCTDTLDTNVVIHLKPNATMPSSVVCVGESEVFDPVVTADTTVSYDWFFPTGNPLFSTDSVVNVSFLTAGNPNISLILTTDYGCKDTFSFPFVVNGGANPDFGIYPICISRFTFDPFYSPGDSAWVVDWSMGDGTLFNDKDTTLFNYNYTAPGTYNVLMTIVDVFGCVDSVTKPVTVSDTISVIMPNVLAHSSTQNNNKVDFEVFKPGFNLCINYTYTIFDRWGVKVFETTNDPYNPDLYCSGCFKGKSSTGAELTPGVYYYVMEGNFNILSTGSITIFE